ncbi:MAG: ArsR/SmtB family transcription factor [Bacteroidota bacterium]
MIQENVLITPAASSIHLQAKLFRGFADPSRLSILEALRDGERTVGDLVRVTRLSQPNVSNHLACLRDCGLVTLRQQGRFAYYSLSDDRVAQLLLLADDLLADVARGVFECTRYNAPAEKDNGSPANP